MGHRSSARSGKASRAGTLDTKQRHREFILATREIILRHGLELLPVHREALLWADIDPDTGERNDQH